MTKEETLKHYTILKNGCWKWLGYKNSGYGRVTIDTIKYQAHRVFYEHYIGPIPEGMQIDHLCRNHWCVNPYHLDPVASRENTQRGNLSRMEPSKLLAIQSELSPEVISVIFGVSPKFVSFLFESLEEPHYYTS